MHTERHKSVGGARPWRVYGELLCNQPLSEEKGWNKYMNNWLGFTVDELAQLQSAFYPLW